MIQLIGIKNHTAIDIREKLSIIPKHIEECNKKLLEICMEVVILSTCNRTEIYFNTKDENDKGNINKEKNVNKEKKFNKEKKWNKEKPGDKEENIIKSVFKILNWDINLRSHIFYVKDKDAMEHLLEVCCGYHSKILGEDQILGQVKSALEQAVESESANRELYRLFQVAITCGKDFKLKTEMYKIPVSSASIVASECKIKNFKNILLVGYGEVGALVTKYLIQTNIEKLYIALRKLDLVEISDERVEVISFDKRKDIYANVDCIICATSAPHPVIFKKDVENLNLTIYDLAIPRDVEEAVLKLPNISTFDIDDISLIDDENRKKRNEIMFLNKHIVSKYMDEYLDWKKVREITPYIQKMILNGEKIYKERYLSFRNKVKSKENAELAQVLIKSTSDAYINKAIKVLKEEHLEGRSEECLKILEKIFL